MLRWLGHRLAEDKLTPLEAEIAAQRLPIPADPQTPTGVRRVSKIPPSAAAVIIGALCLAGVWTLGERQAEAAHLEALRNDRDRLSAEVSGMTSAYLLAQEDELRERGLENSRIGVEGLPDVIAPAPVQVDTLAIKSELDQKRERARDLQHQISQIED